MKAFRRIDKETLTLAKTRLTDVIESDCMTKSKSPQSHSSSVAPSAAAIAQAAVALGGQKVNLDQRQAALQGGQDTFRPPQGGGDGGKGGHGCKGGKAVTPTPPPPPNHGGDPGQMSNRKRKQLLWKGGKPNKQRR